MANNYQNRIDNVNSAMVQNSRNISMPNSQLEQPQQQGGQEEQPAERKPAIPSNVRLNAMDSTLLENEAYQDIEDDKFKAEYRISKLEQKIKSLDMDIESAKNINDLQKIDILVMRKHACQNELRAIKEKYGNADITTKLSDDITNIMSMNPNFLTNAISKIRNYIGQKILSKYSKSFNANQDVRQALAKLKTLNKNVDELINMQTPYGEADDWYDKLSDYLNTANVIHYQISKTVGTPTFLDTISSIDKEKLNKKPKNSSNFNNMSR